MKIKELEKMDTSARFRFFDWEKAKTFYYVSKYGSFSKAAQFLHTSQPSLSRQVMALEEHLGCPLFSRQSRGVSLTRKGEQLARIIENMFLEIKEFTTDVHVSTSNKKERKIRIATSYAVAAYIINDLIIDYNKLHPHLSFDIIGNDYTMDIFLNDVDIAITPLDPQTNDLSNHKSIYQDYLLGMEKKLYASQDYIDHYGLPKTVDDLKKHRLISLAHPADHPYVDTNWILKLGLIKGAMHTPAYTSNSFECLMEVAKNGLGIVSGYNEMKIIRDSKLINILPEVKCDELKFYFVCPNHLQKDQEIVNIKKYLKEKLIK